MNQSSLQNFAERVLAKGRIGKRMVQDLQRDLLAGWDREPGNEAEILIGLDRQAGTAHASWSAYFIGDFDRLSLCGAHVRRGRSMRKRPSGSQRR